LARSAGTEISFDQLVVRAQESPAGSNGLLFLPYLNGERCPYPDPDAKGAFIGLTTRHTDADLTRSLMEGVIFALRDIYELMLEAGIGAKQIRASGGGASSLFWRQIQADIFGCDVVTTEGAAEGGAFGAALVAGVGAGIWRDAHHAAGLCRIDESQAPDPAALKPYAQMLGIYRDLYPALTASFRLLSDPIFTKQEPGK
ncbi:MAG: FGGY-family carbohydrate kinase, partial [Alphaproteobacteria bacterium]